MKRHSVLYTASAQADISESYQWGCKKWGRKQAQQWVRHLRDLTRKQLVLVPQAFPLAPENEKLKQERIRQVIVGRYRVLFTIEGRKVYVLHVRGAFVQEN